MSEVNKINFKSVHSVIANASGSPLDGCLHSEDCTNNVPALINDNDQGDFPGKVKEIKGSESKNHDRSELAKEPSKAISKILQCDTKLQTSEIKERVMGFFTKYAKVDEASGCGPNTVPLFLKKESAKEKEIDDLNANDNASDVPERETLENLNVKKNLNCGISGAKLAVTSPLTPKLIFAAESKDLAESRLSQLSSCESSIQNSPAISNQEEMSIKQLNKFRSDSFLKTNNFLSTLSDVKPVHPSVSTSENDPDSENSSLMDTLGSELHGLQLDNVTMLNTLELEPLGNQLKTNSNVLNQSDHSDRGSQYERAKENELNAHDTLSNNLLSDENNSFGPEMKCASKTSLRSFTSSVPSLNDNVSSLSTNNVCVAVNTFFSPWEKMSFQPQTTPSINSPILSSKSSNNNCTSNYTGYSECRPVIFQSENVNSGTSVWSSSLDCAPRAKNSDTIDNSGHTLTGRKNYSNNTNALDFFESCRKLPEKSTSSKSSVDGENVCDFSVNNADRNSQKTLRGSKVDYFSGPTKGNMTFDRINHGSPFKTSSSNPFMKKAPVQSIGLYKSPVRTTICGFGNFISKPELLSKSVVSSIEEKVEDSMENSSRVKKSNPPNQNIPQEPSQYLFQTFENKSNQKHESSGFLRNVCNEGLSVDTEKPNQVQEVIGSKNNLHSEFLKSGFSFQSGVDVSPLQFTLSSGKPKSFTATHMQRFTKKFMKPVGQCGKGFSYPVIDMNEISNASNIIKEGTCDPFVPASGFDIHDYKTVNVRYQNITLMKEYLDVSTEELRYQFYIKFKSWPFKFCASREPHCCKKTKSQETQTDEDLTCKKLDLGGIWRVLECPVCLDVVLPPVYQCEQGHHVCLPCWNKVITCPLCKRQKSATRNYMAEALVEQVPLPCRYHIEGCKESVHPANKMTHEEICVFRTYQCPVPLCNNAHSYQNMCKHFKKSHKSLLHHKSHSVAKGEKFYEVLYMETLSDTLVRAFDIANWGLFFLREITVKHSAALYMQIMPAVSDQAAYFYHLEVSDHRDCRQECYKGRVFPIGKPSQEIVNQEEYLGLSEIIMKTVKKTTPLKIVVRIWQLKSAFTFSKD